MDFLGIIYLLAVTVGICLAYFPLYYFFTYFFKNSNPPPPSPQRTFTSLLLVVLISFTVYVLSFSIQSIEFGNRIIHSMGGGFLGTILCFMVVRDSRLKIDKIRFLILTFLVVTTLGVFNEIIEFFLQNNFSFTAAPNVNDTWLDLISNTVGIILASICLLPFLNKNR